MAIWPGGCTALIGVYSADDSKPHSYQNSLAGGESPDRKPYADGKYADRVEISVPTTGTLKIVAYQNEAVVAQRQFTEHDRTLYCGAGEAVLSGYGGFVADQGVIGYANDRRTLSKDEDGFLIENYESSGVGAYGLFPFIGKSKRWIRYKPSRLDEDSILKKN